MGKCKYCGGHFDDRILQRHKRENPQFGLQCDHCENMIYDPTAYMYQQMFPGSKIYSQENLPDTIRQHTFKGKKQRLDQSGCKLFFIMLLTLSLIMAFIIVK